MSLVEDIVRRLESLTDRIVNLEMYEHPAVYAVRVYNTRSLAIPNTALTALQYDTERYDYGDLFNIVNNTRLTAPSDGIYVITANVEWYQYATGYRSLSIRLNAATTIAAARILTTIAAIPARMALTTQWELDKTDYVEALVYQNSGGDLDVLSTSAFSPEFMMTRVA